MSQNNLRNLPIICLDFDGVIHAYDSGWQGIDRIPDPPVPGALDWLYEALTQYVDQVQIAIYSTRSESAEGVAAMRGWLFDQFTRGMGLGKIPARGLVNKILWPASKPPALVTIDDRAVTFEGNWPELRIEQLLAFRPWSRRPPPDDRITPIDWEALRRRSGRFELPMGMVQRDPEGVLAIMAHMIILRAEHRALDARIRYDAISPLFDVRPPGKPSPDYRVTVSADDGTVTATRLDQSGATP